ncbi:MAG: hypothetical protein BWY19_00907 [bacterium ADurb.Bin212]|nr:MAG: hypothetical protein BWY19_00907 [bacterium ADurb.Bin212]
MPISTQSNIPIAGIKDGVTILKTGQYRMILEIAAINFDLKSEQEKNSLIFQYQSFLNSLHFPIEIVVKSNKLDLSPYLKKIESLIPKQTNELLKIQTQDYVDFVGQLINLANIMKKRFYVVVGYQPLVVSNSILDKIFKKGPDQNHLKISETDFETYSKELRQRAQTVAQGLGGMGLHCRQLNTKEIIEVFYEIYNPEVAGKERLTDPDDISSSFVSQIKKDGATEDIPIPHTDMTSTVGGEQVIDNQSLVIEHQKNNSVAATTGSSPVAGQTEETEEQEPLPGEKVDGQDPPQPAQTTTTVTEGVSATPTVVDETAPENSNNQNYGL